MLAEVLHKVIEMDQQKQGKYRPRPSLAGPERCIRSLDYLAQGYTPNPFPGRALTVMEDSSWHEQLIKDQIRKSAFQIHSEQMPLDIPAPGLNPEGYFCYMCKQATGKWVKVPPNHIHAHIDGVVTDMLQNDHLLEIKALSHFGFEKIWAGELPLDYIYQSFSYIKGLKDHLNDGILFIKNKNQAQYLDLILQYENSSDTGFVQEMMLSTGERKDICLEIPKIIESTWDRFREVDRYAQEKKLHDRQYDRDSWRCDYCQYGQTCWEGWEEEIKNLPDTINLDDIDFQVDCEALTTLNAEIKQREELKEEIENRLKKAIQGKGRRGVAGEWTFGIRPQQRTWIDQKKLDPAIAKAATTTKMIEVFEPPRKRK
jgi:hypothetical protein